MLGFVIKFVQRAFRGSVETLLWINLLVWAIGGEFVGFYMIEPHSDSHSIIGGVIGLIIGLWLNIVGDGFIAIILNIHENLKELK
jgi:phosphate/sulfate permease